MMTTTRTKTAVTTIRMEPSSSSSSSMEATSTSTTAEDGARQLPQVHAEEPFVYNLPKGVHPTYRPLPLSVQAVVVFLSTWTSAVTTWQRLTWLQPLAILRGWCSPPTAMEVLGFAIKVRKTVCHLFVLMPNKDPIAKAHFSFFYDTDTALDPLYEYRLARPLLVAVSTFDRDIAKPVLFAIPAIQI
jgi:hypothetical protein